MLLAIEGLDGAGKGTQAKMLRDRVREEGYKVELISFPRYQETKTSQLITAYLNGEFGEIREVPPHFAATLFAMERLESRQYIEEMRQECELVIVDRYVASNLAYQSARFIDPKSRSTFMEWLADLEFEKYAMPFPQLSIFLEIPVRTSQKLVAQKKKRSYTQETYDLHEQDTEYLSSVLGVYNHLFKESSYVKPSKIINCQYSFGEMRDVEDIAEELAKIIFAELACCT